MIVVVLGSVTVVVVSSLGDRGSAHYLGVGLPVVGFVIAFGIFAYVANKSRR
jgi:hypothetical protein